MARTQKKSVEFHGTGRRKGTASARVFLRPGSGKLEINGRPLEQYFPVAQLQVSVTKPFRVTEMERRFDAYITVKGGGITGQAEAIQLGLSRALKEYELSSFPQGGAAEADQSNFPIKTSLRRAGLLTANSCKKERKKVGKHGARRGTQFSKR